jgi:hypothetical protein
LCNLDSSSIGDQLRNDAEWLTVIQSCHHCLTQQTQLQTELEQDLNKYVSIGEWQIFQASVQAEFLPGALALVDCDAQLRSLLPEVVRLLKLLQMDWQFWQAARQAATRSHRRQQFLQHLIQMGQLLTAIHTTLGVRTESRPS